MTDEEHEKMLMEKQRFGKKKKFLWKKIVDFIRAMLTF
jgi:hypothetical protein